MTEFNAENAMKWASERSARIRLGLGEGYGMTRAASLFLKQSVLDHLKAFQISDLRDDGGPSIAYPQYSYDVESPSKKALDTLLALKSAIQKFSIPDTEVRVKEIIMGYHPEEPFRGPVIPLEIETPWLIHKIFIEADEMKLYGYGIDYY